MNKQLGLGLAGAGVVLILIGLVAPPLAGSTTTNPYYSVCNVTSQNGVAVIACSGQVIGPQPDGSYIVMALVSIIGGCNGSPVFTWSWGGGASSTTSGGISTLTVPSAFTSITVSFTATVGSYSASGSMTIYNSPGASSFTNSLGMSSFQSCTMTTSAVPMTTAITTTYSSTTTTINLPRSPTTNLPIVLMGLGLLVLGGLVSMKKEDSA